MSDFLAVAIMFIAAAYIQSKPHLLPSLPLEQNLKPWKVADFRSYLGYAWLCGALVTLVGHTEGLYLEMERSLQEQSVALAKAVWWSTLLVGLLMWLSGTPIYLTALGCSAVLNVAALMGVRFWRRNAAARKVAAGTGVRNLLIVGAGRQGREIAEYFKANPQTCCVVKGFLDDSSASDADVIGHLEDLPQVARAQFIDEVILAIPEERDSARRVIQLSRQNRLDVRIVPDLFGCEPLPSTIERLGEIPLISLHRESLPAFQLALKRIIDVLLSCTALLLLAPLLAAIAMLVKLDSQGGVIYGAPRVGRKGRRFRCYKFRTMVRDADALKEKLRAFNQREGPCFKVSQDPRVTRVGRYLRRYSLDELPQLWNVLKGEMSLVGPRPHPLDDFARYQLDHLRRLDVTPGITGLWQVTARTNPSFQTNLALDLEYIEKWSLWLDLRLLFKTLFIVMAGSGV